MFDSFEAFKVHSNLLGKYELFIDSYTHLTLTHQIIAVQTGSGKSYTLHGYLLQMLLKPIPYHLYFADSKVSSIALSRERVLPETTADDFELSPHVLIFVEFADFSLFLQSKDKKILDHVNSLISLIVLKGR